MIPKSMTECSDSKEVETEYSQGVKQNKNDVRGRLASRTVVYPVIENHEYASTDEILMSRMMLAGKRTARDIMFIVNKTEYATKVMKLIHDRALFTP